VQDVGGKAHLEGREGGVMATARRRARAARR
jgi:hypothetical protein